MAIHEAFLTPDQLVKLYSMSPGAAIGVGTYIHTPPQAFGKVMSTIKPRHAIAYHFMNESDTRDSVYGYIRETYDGPLTLAEDNLVWNITKKDITVRSIVSADDAWSQIGPNKPLPPDRTVPSQLSKEMLAGRWDISDTYSDMIKEFKEEHGLK